MNCGGARVVPIPPPSASVRPLVDAWLCLADRDRLSFGCRLVQAEPSFRAKRLRADGSAIETRLARVCGGPGNSGCGGGASAPVALQKGTYWRLSMAGKGDFSEAEWQTLEKSVTGAAMLVSIADPKLFDMFKESAAMAGHLNEAR